MGFWESILAIALILGVFKIADAVSELVAAFEKLADTSDE